MPSTYSNLKIELIATGEQSGTWGTTTNTNLGTAIEEAITGSADVTFTNGNDTTITLTDVNTTQAARNLRLNLVGSSTGAQNLILGSGCQIEKLYLINNTLGHTITVKNTTGTGIAVPAGKKMVVYNDGTNVVNAVDYFGSLSVDITGGTINNTVIGGSTPPAGTFTQVNITGQGDLRLEDTTGGEYVALQAPSSLAGSYTLTMPPDDGTNGQALITDGSGNLSWSTAASGDVYGPASATDNAIARFDLTTGKLIQNSSALVDDAGNVLAGAGTVSVPAFSTTGDTNTGIFFPAADTIAFAEGGVEAMRIDSGGRLLISTTTSPSSSYTLSLGTSNFALAGGYSVGNENTGIYSQTANVLQFQTNNSEKMRITSGGDVGINTTSPNMKLEVKGTIGGPASSGTTPTGIARFSHGSGSYVLDFGVRTSPDIVWIQATDANNLAVNAPLGININGGNVGIGTSSPTSLLDVNTNSNGTVQASVTNLNAGSSARAQVSLLSDSANGTLAASSSTNTAAALGGRASTFALFTGSGDTPGGIALLARNSAGYITMHTGGNTERMRITSGGSVGIGTSSPQTRLHIEQNSSPAIRLIRTGYAYTELKGSTGASGNDFTINMNGTDRVHLTNIGNLGIGTTSPVAITNYTIATINNATTGSAVYLQQAGADKGRFIATASDVIVDTQAAIPLIFGTNSSERMRIDSSGNVGIGCTPSAVGAYRVLELNNTTGGILYLQANGTRSIQLYGADTEGGLYQMRNAPLIFGANNTERMRITSGGDLLVGTTTVDAVQGISIKPNVTNGSGAIIFNKSTTGDSYPMEFRYNGAAKGYILYNQTSTTYSTTSDYRLKENIEPMTGALDKVSALKPCIYTWKIDGSVGQGFVAHELQEIVPQCVTGEKDAVNEDGSIKPQGIDTSFLVATLTAAIQELNAKVEAQAAEIALLKSK